MFTPLPVMQQSPGSHDAESQSTTSGVQWGCEMQSDCLAHRPVGRQVFANFNIVTNARGQTGPRRSSIELVPASAIASCASVSMSLHFRPWSGGGTRSAPSYPLDANDPRALRGHVAKSMQVMPTQPAFLVNYVLVVVDRL